MTEDESRLVIYCDRCHRHGDDACPDRNPRWFGSSLTVETKKQAQQIGWWIGRLWEYCPGCKSELGLKSREKK